MQKLSWPGLARPSTPSGVRRQDVDARHKAGQDDYNLYYDNVKFA